MKGIFLVSLIVVMLGATLAGCTVPAAKFDPAKTYARAELEEDFIQFRRIIEKSSPLLYTDKRELGQMMDHHFTLIRDGMNEMEFLRLLAPIVAQLRCGHTHLYASKGYEHYLNATSLYLPLDIRVIEQRLYTVTDAAGIPAGSEILDISGRSAKAIVGTLLDNLTSDAFDINKKLFTLNHYFAGVYNYYYGSSTAYQVSYRDTRSGEPKTATVQGIRENSKNINMMIPYGLDILNQKLYSGEIHGDYALLTIKFFMGFNRKEYSRFLKDFFEELSEKGVKSLILDVRGNWGGTPGPARELYQYLISEPSPYLGKTSHPLLFMYRRPVKPHQYRFSGNLYTLIDGAGFSTTSHFLALLKHHRIGTMVGETTSGGVLCTDGSTEKKLRNSGLRFYSSNRPFEAAAPSLKPGEGIAPDHPVTMTLADYLYNRDPYMLKALELIGN